MTIENYKSLIKEIIKSLCEVISELQANDCDTPANLEDIKQKLLELENGSDLNG